MFLLLNNYLESNNLSQTIIIIIMYFYIYLTLFLPGFIMDPVLLPFGP